MPYKTDISTAGVATGAATSPAWLPSAEDSLSVAAHPLWADLLAPLGVLWLIIQIGFFFYDKLRKRRAEIEEVDR